MTDICNTDHKLCRLIDQIKVIAEENAMSSDQIATFKGDCWQHLRNIWCGDMIKQLSNDISKIPTIYCITTNVEDLLHCIEKEFGLSGELATRQAVLGLMAMVGYLSTGHLLPVKVRDIATWLGSRQEVLKVLGQQNR